MKKIFISIIIVSILVTNAYAVNNIHTSAECAVLYDTLSGECLYTENAYERHLIASTTKIMTALVVVENCDMDDEVEIKPEHVRVEGSSMYLRIGEVVTVRELLYGLLLMSGNDAGLTLAYHCGGDVESFVRMMNEYASKLGLENTSFENPHGLDGERHYSTAYELAVLTEHAMKNETFREIVGCRNYNSGTRSMQNHNKLLWKYDGAVGVKTGFTKAAGRCLVSAAERDGRMLIAVTLNAPDDWNDHMKLYDSAFGGMESVYVAEEGKSVGKIPVVGGENEYIELFVHESIVLNLKKDDEITVELYADQFVYAPVIDGGYAGKIRVYCGSRMICERDIFFGENVKRSENVFLKILNELLAKFIAV